MKYAQNNGNLGPTMLKFINLLSLLYRTPQHPYLEKCNESYIFGASDWLHPLTPPAFYLAWEIRTLFPNTNKASEI